MRVRLLTALIGALLVAAAGMAPATAATTSGAGLWSSDYAPAPSDCGSWIRDANGFCEADDPGAVELGVKFRTSQPIRISGVRVYRVDGDPQTGSLWSTDGTLLATGTFSPGVSHAWQDLTFSSPVSIVPGQTYIASYFAPNAHYAFEYSFFSTSALTVGPLTALQSVEGDRNGVYCYQGQPCNLFPTETYRDQTYWVTPVWSYAFAGFFQPVDNLPAWNSAKAGSAIPVKFGLGGNLGTDVLRAGYPKATTIACPGSTSTVDPIEQTVTAVQSGLTYDATADQYSYVWKTDKASAGTCVQFELGLKDGSSHTFQVKFTK